MWVAAHLVYGNGNILEHRVLWEISSSVHRGGQQTDEVSLKAVVKPEVLYSKFSPAPWQLCTQGTDFFVTVILPTKLFEVFYEKNYILIYFKGISGWG